jgi:PDZ domain-containing secreted protein
MSEEDARKMSVAISMESWRCQKMAEHKLQARKEIIREEEITRNEQEREECDEAQRSMDETIELDKKPVLEVV